MNSKLLFIKCFYNNKIKSKHSICQGSYYNIGKKNIILDIIFKHFLMNISC